MNKKAQLLGQVGGTFQQIAFLAIFGSVILVILSQINSSIAYGHYGNNASKLAIDNVTRGMGNFFAQLPLFGTILGLLLIVGIVFLLIRGSRGSAV